MKLTQEKDTINVTGSLEELEVGITQESAYYLITAVVKLYADPIGSVVREIASNGIDAMRESQRELKNNPNSELSKWLHKENKKILISYREQSDMHGVGGAIEFTDYGIGISKDRMTKIFLNIASSSKRGTNEEIGGYGVGSKSPWSYRNIFYIRTNYMGTSYLYMMKFQDNTAPKANLLFTEPTKELNETTIIVPLKNQGDVDVFRKAINRQLFYFTEVVTINFGETTKNISNYSYSFNDDVYVVPLQSSGSFDFNPLHLCIGRVIYPIDFKLLSDKLSELSSGSMDIHLDEDESVGLYYSIAEINQTFEFFKSRYYNTYNPNYSIGLRFKIGDLDLVPSRESVSYSDKTAIAIFNKMCSSKRKASESIKYIINKLEDYWIEHIFNRPFKEFYEQKGNSYKKVLFMEQQSGNTADEGGMIMLNAFNIKVDTLFSHIQSSFLLNKEYAAANIESLPSDETIAKKLLGEFYSVKEFKDVIDKLKDRIRREYAPFRKTTSDVPLYDKYYPKTFGIALDTKNHTNHTIEIHEDEAPDIKSVLPLVNAGRVHSIVLGLVDVNYEFSLLTNPNSKVKSANRAYFNKFCVNTMPVFKKALESIDTDDVNERFKVLQPLLIAFSKALASWSRKSLIKLDKEVPITNTRGAEDNFIHSFQKFRLEYLVDPSRAQVLSKYDVAYPVETASILPIKGEALVRLLKETLVTSIMDANKNGWTLPNLLKELIVAELYNEKAVEQRIKTVCDSINYDTKEAFLNAIIGYNSDDKDAELPLDVFAEVLGITALTKKSQRFVLVVDSIPEFAKNLLNMVDELGGVKNYVELVDNLATQVTASDRPPKTHLKRVGGLVTLVTYWIETVVTLIKETYSMPYSIFKGKDIINFNTQHSTFYHKFNNVLITKDSEELTSHFRQIMEGLKGTTNLGIFKGDPTLSRPWHYNREFEINARSYQTLVMLPVLLDAVVNVYKDSGKFYSLLGLNNYSVSIPCLSDSNRDSMLYSILSFMENSSKNSLDWTLPPSKRLQIEFKALQDTGDTHYTNLLQAFTNNTLLAEEEEEEILSDNSFSYKFVRYLTSHQTGYYNDLWSLSTDLENKELSEAKIITRLSNAMQLTRNKVQFTDVEHFLEALEQNRIIFYYKKDLESIALINMYLMVRLSANSGWSYNTSKEPVRFIEVSAKDYKTLLLNPEIDEYNDEEHVGYVLPLVAPYFTNYLLFNSPMIEEGENDAKASNEISGLSMYYTVQYLKEQGIVLDEEVLENVLKSVDIVFSKVVTLNNPTNIIQSSVSEVLNSLECFSGEVSTEDLQYLKSMNISTVMDLFSNHIESKTGYNLIEELDSILTEEQKQEVVHLGFMELIKNVHKALPALRDTAIKLKRPMLLEAIKCMDNFIFNTLKEVAVFDANTSAELEDISKDLFKLAINIS